MTSKFARKNRAQTPETRAKISATMRARGIRPDGKVTIFFKPRPIKGTEPRRATTAEIMWLLQATPAM
jgi:hypothetical protein